MSSCDFGHYKNNIYFYNILIFNTLKSKGLKFDFVHYPSSQFKNQFNFANMLFHAKDHGVKADWNFFASSRGRGENGGVGGDVKNYGKKCFDKKRLLTV